MRQSRKARARVYAYRFALASAIVFVGSLAGCSGEESNNCTGNSDCQTNQCVAGRCVPVDDADATDALPNGDTPSDDVGDVVDQDIAADPGADPPEPASTLGTSCSSDSGCSTGEWCPTNTSQRRCSPRPTMDAVQMPFQYVPAGSFIMGSPSGELGRSSNEAQIFVRLARNVFVQRTELTQGQWTALSGGTNPSCLQTTSGRSCTSSNANPNGPVEQVSWWSVLGYANALSTSQNLPTCYTLPTSGCSGSWQAGNLGCREELLPTVTGGNVYRCAGYRLLTEAEWEYAARAGTTTATHVGNLSGSYTDCTTAQANVDGIAWWCRNSSRRAQAVGGKTPNDWGLYDMLGNVWEWTWDRYTDRLPGGTDPRFESSGSDRVFRGGSWFNTAQFTRAAYRSNYIAPNFQDGYLGVRLARTCP